MTVNPGSNAGTQGTGGQVEFTGSITDSSCNVDSTSANQSVDLGKWASSYFTGAGSETTKTAFHIKVKDCPSTVTTVSVLFDGTRDTNNSDLLAINGTASGVAIKLYEDDKSTPVDLGAVSRGHSVTAGASGGSGYRRSGILCRLCLNQRGFRRFCQRYGQLQYGLQLIP
jgi:major type 1 subunit fimbrin (pilin)